MYPAAMSTTSNVSVYDALMLAADRLEVASKREQYRKDPALWYKERKGGHFWSRQKEIADSLVVNKYTAVKSGHSVGKTHLSAELSQWWIDTSPNLDDTIVITTGPTFQQVVGVLWEYIRKGHRDLKLVGEINERAEWRAGNPRMIIGQGVKPADGNSTALQGRHYQHTLVIVDEACGVPKEIFQVIDAIVISEDCRVLAIGNPTDPNTYFGDIFLLNSGRGIDSWNKLTISVLDNPNFTGEDCPEAIKKNLAGPQSVKKWKEEYGEDSNEYKFRVKGEFPDSADNALFPLHLLYSATEVELEVPLNTPSYFGVDLARFKDHSAIVKNTGGEVTVVDMWQGLTTHQSAQRIHEKAVEHGVEEIRVDSLGPEGRGVIDELRLLAVNYSYTIIEMNGSAASSDAKQFLNARAEWHYHVKKELIAGRMRLPSGPTGSPEAKLFDEMRNIRYKYARMGTGPLQIEAKEEMKKRGLKSPDISDALMYASFPSIMADPLAGYEIGDMFTTLPEDVLDELLDQDWAISPV